MSKLETFGALAAFRKTWVAHGWSWDSRFDCAASTFDQARRDAARDALERVFPVAWTSNTLPRAPGGVREVAELTGGVRTDQVLYVMSDPDLLCFALWWPWGSETTNTSVRVGLHRASHDDVWRLRQTFGVADD